MESVGGVSSFNTRPLFISKSHTFNGFNTRVEFGERLRKATFSQFYLHIKKYLSFAPVTIQLFELYIENIGPACAGTIRSNIFPRQMKTNPVILPV